jgi:hypothetical protein
MGRHVAYMAVMRNEYKILVGKLEQRHKWEHNNITNLKEVWSEWIHMAQHTV